MLNLFTIHISLNQLEDIYIEATKFYLRTKLRALCQHLDTDLWAKVNDKKNYKMWDNYLFTLFSICIFSNFA